MADKQVGTSDVINLHPPLWVFDNWLTIQVKSFENGNPEEYPKVVTHLGKLTKGVNPVSLPVFQNATQSTQMAFIVLGKVIEHLDGIVHEQRVGVEEKNVAAFSVL